MKVGEREVKDYGNLIPVKNSEEAKRRGRNGGLKAAETKRRKKNMREAAKMLMQMQVMGDANRNTLSRFGIKEEDQTYQTAIVVRLLDKALTQGDTQAIKLLGQLTGEMNQFGDMMPTDDEVYGGVIRPPINLPANGRDPYDSFQLAPQPGPQTQFFTSPADIIIYGGAAGGGKTFALLLEALRHKDVKNFTAAIFRKNYVQITSPGGLWDASMKIYNQVDGAVPHKSPRLNWTFGGGEKLSFAHIETDDGLSRWQGSEIAYIGFDELTHFTKKQFLYMLSRNRSTCGVKPYVRATCNPDADSWVADFIQWWWDPNTGYPIEERSGRLRWMLNLKDVIYWADTKEELVEKYECKPEDPKSVTFIASKLEDNKILMESDPSYLSNLKALAEIDMERLLYGNWKIKPSAGKFFKRAQVEMLDILPDDIVYYCRAWDLAATDEDENGDADYTAGVLYGRRKNGKFVVIDVINQQIKAGDVRKLIKEVALSDRNKYGWMCMVRVPQDPGAAGKIVARELIKDLAGFNVKADTVSGSKEVRATPHAAQWQNGNVQIMRGAWNEIFFSQLESFPESKHDDIVDASSDAFNELANMEFDIDNLL